MIQDDVTWKGNKLTVLGESGEVLGNLFEEDESLMNTQVGGPVFDTIAISAEKMIEFTGDGDFEFTLYSQTGMTGNLKLRYMKLGFRCESCIHINATLPCSLTSSIQIYAQLEFRCVVLMRIHEWLRGTNFGALFPIACAAPNSLLVSQIHICIMYFLVQILTHFVPSRAQPDGLLFWRRRDRPVHHRRGDAGAGQKEPVQSGESRNFHPAVVAVTLYHPPFEFAISGGESYL